MDEIFVEQLIKRKLSMSALLLRMVSVLIVFIGVLSILWLGILGMTLTVLLAYAAYLIWGYTSVEYEYSFLNGELSVDKIMGQRKRSTVGVYHIKDAEIIAPAMSEDILSRIKNTKTKDFSSGYKSEALYSMIINSSEGVQQILFEPNEKVIRAMYHVRPSIVKKKIQD